MRKKREKTYRPKRDRRARGHFLNYGDVWLHMNWRGRVVAGRKEMGWSQRRRDQMRVNRLRKFESSS